MNEGCYKELPERRERPAGSARKLYLRVGTHCEGYLAAGLFTDPGSDAGSPVEWLTDGADAARAAADLESADRGSLCRAIAAERIERGGPRKDRIHIPRQLRPWSVQTRDARRGEPVVHVWATGEKVAVAAAPSRRAHASGSTRTRRRRRNRQSER